MNFSGTKDDVISMLGGGRIRVNVEKYENTIDAFYDKDDVFTYSSRYILRDNHFTKRDLSLGQVLAFMACDMRRWHFSYLNTCCTFVALFACAFS